MGGPVIAAIAIALIGGAVMGAAAFRSRRMAPDLGEFLVPLDDQARDPDMIQPLVVRLLGGVLGLVARRLERLVPANYMAKIDTRLTQAGIAGRRRPAQQLAIQLAGAAAGLALVPLLPTLTPLKRMLAIGLLPLMGVMLPAARLTRKIRARSEAIFADLPDIVDMLAIAVEAGCGFEAALSLVCKNFDSPLADELSTALQEMELGLPRRDALQRLRERVKLDTVGILVLSLLQADALGIPIGRVLKSQATEVRARRRSWAREKAAKLPVKIMFPLVLFIFPPIMVMVLAPAAMSFGEL